MWGKRITSMLLMSLIIIGIISIPVSAAEVDNSSQASGQMNLANARATGVLNFTLSANTSKVAGQKFQMDAGETVRINASYTPFAADVDFGLVDSDGVFHYINVTDGNIDETILIEEKGYYSKNKGKIAAKQTGSLYFDSSPVCGILGNNSDSAAARMFQSLSGVNSFRADISIDLLGLHCVSGWPFRHHEMANDLHW